MGMAKLRAVLISDVHYGRDVGNKKGAQAPALMEEFIKFANNAKPDVVIDLGDRISCYSAEVDRRETRKITAYFNRIAAPRIHLLGNHDVRFMKRATSEKILGQKMASSSVEIGGVQIVVWNPDVKYELSRSVKMPQKEIDWLEAELKKSDKPVLLLSHMPVDFVGKSGQTVTNSKGDLVYKHFADAEQIRAVLQKSGRNFLNLAGDHHRNYFTQIGDTYYITMHSLTQKAKHIDEPSGAYALLEIDGDEIRLDVYGHEPASYRLNSKVLKKLGGAAPAP
jgi:predicted MPP superfamily phosphohydrolase